MKSSDAQAVFSVLPQSIKSVRDGQALIRNGHVWEGMKTIDAALKQLEEFVPPSTEKAAAEKEPSCS
jgi:hypothetical protein